MMKTKATPRAIALIIGTFVMTCQAAPDRGQAVAKKNRPDGNEAKAVAVRWLEGLDEKGLVLNERVKEGGFVVSHGPGAQGRVTKFTYEQSGWWVTLAFHGDLTPETPLNTLKKRFWYVALDKVPTPGLNLRDWDVKLQTPQSSVEKGVEIQAYHDGRIKLRVRTKFFALYGRDTSVVVPADAPAPVGAYFQIRKELPLDLTMDAPVAFSE